jgi:hypothetical protein
LSFGDKGIVQVNAKKSESFSFQLFDNKLKLLKENIVVTEGKFADNADYDRMIRLKNKTYLFVQEYYKETKQHGISAVEFSFDKLDLTGGVKKILKSSTKLKIRGDSEFRGLFEQNRSTDDYRVPMDEFFDGPYKVFTSNDETKFMYVYSLLPEEKKDKLSKEIVGIHVFDENLNKLWGGEYEMPNTEALMDNLGYVLGNDGKVYLVARVYNSEEQSEYQYHFEVLTYDGKSETPVAVKIKIDGYFTKDAYIFEDQDNKILVSGFYASAANKLVEGAYLVQLDVGQSKITKLFSGNYEFGSDIIKSHTSEKAKERLEKKEEKDGGKLGVTYLRMRKVYRTPNGSIKIIGEQHNVTKSVFYTPTSGPNAGLTRSTVKMAGSKEVVEYYSYYNDIYVISIAADGKMEWIRKIPKKQTSAGMYGKWLSFNSLTIGNDLHIFYNDDVDNIRLAEGEAPKLFRLPKNGCLMGIRIKENGDIDRFGLNKLEDFDTEFFIKRFVNGKNNNLVWAEKRRKKNMLFSIEVK